MKRSDEEVCHHYNFVIPSITTLALSRHTAASACWERGQGRRRRSSQTLDAAPSTPTIEKERSAAQYSGASFLVENMFAITTLARSVIRRWRTGPHHPSIRLQPIHD